jgi:triacylglycerol lipase
VLTVRQRICALFVLLAALLAPMPAQAAERVAGTVADQASSGNPVVFVHGYNADPGVWGGLRADLRAAGYPDSRLFSWGYDTHQSVNEVLAGRFAAYVDQVRRETGADRVDVVSHSFGSLVSRWYVKHGGGTATVERWISLAGPNHGTYISWGCVIWDQACRDMSPGSYVQRKLAEGDETPGAVRYATFWSDCDEVINPDSSVPLSGAANTYAGCLKHNDFLGDDGVSAGVRAFLASGGAGTGRAGRAGAGRRHPVRPPSGKVSRWSRPQVNSATTGRPPSGSAKASCQRVGAVPSLGRTGAKARATSSTVQLHGSRSAPEAGCGPAAPGARTSHSFQTDPSGPAVTSNRRSGQGATGHSSTSQARSPRVRRAVDSGGPSTER